MLRARSFRPLGWLLASAWLGVACSGTHEPTQAITAAGRPGVGRTANVPALVGLSIDELAGRLGQRQPVPATFATSAEAAAAADSSRGMGPDSLASFRTGGLTLIANYSARSRRVHDLLVLGHNEDSLMARSALRSSSRQYLVLPVFASDRPSYLLGLRVIITN
jgi:hypothetical protein